MKVDRQELLDNGFIILRNVISPAGLEDLRAQFETLVERQKEAWAAENSDTWETGAQPRLVHYERLIDPATAGTVELWQRENTLGVARQLLSVPERTSVAGMMLMCSPQRDHGPAVWHRDIHPLDMAPMAVLQRDLMENGPRYLQWNIPLYDDVVFWAVPGSHLRLNTAEEDRQLEKDPRQPLPGGVPIELAAGDGVVYSNYLLHWGSNYSTTRRRTAHGGHSIFPYYADTGFMKQLSPEGRAAFESWDRGSAAAQDLTEQALRAVLDGDAGAFHEAVEGLQPGAGKKGKLVLAIYLSKAAYHLHVLKQPADSELPRWAADREHSITINWGPQFAGRFSAGEAAEIWARFGPLDRGLRADGKQFAPGYQNREPMHHYFEDMPPFDVDGFVAGWAA